jgi:hypothetical protein
LRVACAPQFSRDEILGHSSGALRREDIDSSLRIISVVPALSRNP